MRKREERDDEQGGRILANQRHGNNSSMVRECPDAQDFWLRVLECSRGIRVRKIPILPQWWLLPLLYMIALHVRWFR